MSQTYNLDDVQEYFEFSLKGHTYRFNHMTTEDMEAFREVSDKNKDGLKMMFKFITPVDENSPSFEEASKKMVTPQWVKFREMIEAEMGVKK